MRYKAKGIGLRSRQGRTYGRKVINGGRTQLLGLKNGNWIQAIKKTIKKWR